MYVCPPFVKYIWINKASKRVNQLFETSETLIKLKFMNNFEMKLMCHTMKSVKRLFIEVTSKPIRYFCPS